MQSNLRLVRRHRHGPSLSFGQRQPTEFFVPHFPFEDSAPAFASPNARLAREPVPRGEPAPRGFRRKLHGLELPREASGSSPDLAQDTPHKPVAWRSGSGPQPTEAASGPEFLPGPSAVQMRCCSFSSCSRGVPRAERRRPFSVFRLQALSSRPAFPGVRTQKEPSRQSDSARQPGPEGEPRLTTGETASRLSPPRAFRSPGSRAVPARDSPAPLALHTREREAVSFSSLPCALSSRRFLSGPPRAPLRERKPAASGRVDRRGEKAKAVNPEWRNEGPGAAEASSHAGSSFLSSTRSEDLTASPSSVSTAASSHTFPSVSWQSFAWLAEDVSSARWGCRRGGGASSPTAPVNASCLKSPEGGLLSPTPPGATDLAVSAEPEASLRCSSPPSSLSGSSSSLPSSVTGACCSSPVPENAGRGEPPSPFPRLPFARTDSPAKGRTRKPRENTAGTRPLSFVPDSEEGKTGARRRRGRGVLAEMPEKTRRGAARNKRDEPQLKRRQGRSERGELDETWISKWRGRTTEAARALQRERWIRDLLRSRLSDGPTALQRELLAVLLHREKQRVRAEGNADRRLSPGKEDRHARTRRTHFAFQNLRCSLFPAPPLLHGSRGLSLLFNALRDVPSSSSEGRPQRRAAGQATFGGDAGTREGGRGARGESEETGDSAGPHALAQVAHEVVRDLIYHLPHFSTSHIVTVLRLVSASLPSSCLAFTPSSASRPAAASAVDAFLKDPLELARMPLGEVRLELLAVLSRCVSPTWLLHFTVNEFIGLVSFSQAVGAPSSPPPSARAAASSSTTFEGEAARAAGEDSGARRSAEASAGANPEACASSPKRGGSQGKDDEGWSRRRTQAPPHEVSGHTPLDLRRAPKRAGETVMKQKLRGSAEFSTFLQRICAALPAKLPDFTSLAELAVLAQSLSRLEVLDVATLGALGDRAGFLLCLRRGSEERPASTREEDTSALTGGQSVSLPGGPPGDPVSPRGSSEPVSSLPATCCLSPVPSRASSDPSRVPDELRFAPPGLAEEEAGHLTSSEGEREGASASPFSVEGLVKEVKSAAVLCTLMGRLDAFSPRFQRELFLWLYEATRRFSVSENDQTAPGLSQVVDAPRDEDERAAASASNPSPLPGRAFFQHSPAFLPALSTCLRNSLRGERALAAREQSTQGSAHTARRVPPAGHARTENGDSPRGESGQSAAPAASGGAAVAADRASAAFLFLASRGLPFLDSPAQVASVLRALAQVSRATIWKREKNEERNRQNKGVRREGVPSQRGNATDRLQVRGSETLCSSPACVSEPTRSAVAASPLSACRPDEFLVRVQATQLRALVQLHALLVSGAVDSDTPAPLASFPGSSPSASALSAAWRRLQASVTEPGHPPPRLASRALDVSLFRLLLLALHDVAETTKEASGRARLEPAEETGRTSEAAAECGEGEGGRKCGGDPATSAQEGSREDGVEKAGTPAESVERRAVAARAKAACVVDGCEDSRRSLSEDISLVLALLLYCVFVSPPFSTARTGHDSSLLPWLCARPRELQWSFPLSLRCAAAALSLLAPEALPSRGSPSVPDPKEAGEKRHRCSAPARSATESSEAVGTRQDTRCAVSRQPASEAYRASLACVLAVVDVLLDPSLSSLFFLRVPASHPSHKAALQTARSLLLLRAAKGSASSPRSVVGKRSPPEEAEEARLEKAEEARLEKAEEARLEEAEETQADEAADQVACVARRLARHAALRPPERKRRAETTPRDVGCERRAEQTRQSLSQQ
uniref:Uncharacterized protein n=1 Tax=Neospora caninum (strain Liverpool) TaxID=572307 RepID=F0JB01_NEOCL|nr:hypothetical protein, conserved [Neospora caninum Liverpool]CEL71267.1 TPA: hypothetical protein, conserved [Neospora caninum Liverpool]